MTRTETIVPDLGFQGFKIFCSPRIFYSQSLAFKKQKGKKVAKDKRIVQVDLIDHTPILENKSKANVMAKDFPNPEFMDKELMNPAALERLKGDEEDLVSKF